MRIRIFLIQLILMGCICLWSDIVSLDQYSGTIAEGETDSLTVTISADSLDFGIYNYDIIVNEAGLVEHTIPVEIEVFPAYLPAPQDLLISITEDQVNISWEAVAGAQGYRIFRSDDPETGFSLIGTSEQPAFVDPAGSLKSFYRVKAYYTETRMRSNNDE